MWLWHNYSYSYSLTTTTNNYIKQTRFNMICSTNSFVINWLIHSAILFLKIFITLKPLELESWHFERMFTPPHLSHVICHMSPVTCHMSPVTCHVFFFFLFIKNKVAKLWRWRVCYQLGLPCLVLLQLHHMVRRICLMFKGCVRCTDERSFFSSLEPVPPPPSWSWACGVPPSWGLVEESSEALPAVVPQEC